MWLILNLFTCVIHNNILMSISCYYSCCVCSHFDFINGLVTVTQSSAHKTQTHRVLPRSLHFISCHNSTLTLSDLPAQSQQVTGWLTQHKHQTPNTGSQLPSMHHDPFGEQSITNGASICDSPPPSNVPLLSRLVSMPLTCAMQGRLERRENVPIRSKVGVNTWIFTSPIAAFRHCAPPMKNEKYRTKVFGL